MKIFAKFLDKNGRDHDLEWAREQGLEKGKLYKVENIDIGQSHSSIYLKNIDSFFNSVMFEFYDESNEPMDIFQTEYNPYR